MAEPRYDEEEIRKILARATEVRSESESVARVGDLDPAAPSRQGLTRSDLEEIGARAGIPSARIADAVEQIELERSTESVVETHLGVALTSRHDVILPRRLTDDEWDRFVVQLRDAFDTRGTVTSEGSLRTWSGGDVTVLLEPVSEGARLRFESAGGEPKSLVDAGAALTGSAVVIGALLGVLVPVSGKALPGILIGLVVAMLGLGAGLWALGRHAAGASRTERAAAFSRLGLDVRRLADGSAAD